MNFQDTVLELFESKRIDKSVAYRLLRDIKTQARTMSPRTGRAPAPRRRLSLTLALPADPDWRLMLVVYLLHLVLGKDTVTLALRQAGGDQVIHVRINDRMTPRELLEVTRSQRLDDRRLFQHAPCLWVAHGVPDETPRQITLLETPDPTAPGNGWILEARLARHAEGLTRPADWADCLTHWNRVFTDNPDQPLARLDRLPERHKQLLLRYNATSTYLPPARTLPALLDPVLMQHSAHPAIHARTGTISYDTWSQLAWTLAHQLRAQGAARNQTVAVMLHRTPRLPPALYGVICSGAAYVPLEPDTPAERVRAILQDTGATLLLTDADTLLQQELPLTDTPITRIVCIDRWPRRTHAGLPVQDADDRARHPAHPPACINEPDDLSYVICTSGSTGRPKGVMISHASLINSLIGLNNVFHVHAGDRFMAFSSCAFDLSIWDFFGAALAGAAVILPDSDERLDPEAMWQLMHRHQATLWNSVPTAMNQLLSAFRDKGGAPLPSLRLAMLGGEFITPALLADVMRAFPNTVVSNGGGATEGTIYSNLCHPVTRFRAGWKSIPYGVPLPNQRLHVLNDEMRPCAIGEKGMIWIGGQGVAIGYLGDPEKTAAAFLPAPWSDDPDDRIYRTGDIGIMRADGMIEFCGRIDRQVKLRGYRIELGDIENTLGAHDAIEQCAIIVRRIGEQPAGLIAYYISRDALRESELRDYLAKRLPAYMVPDGFRRLEDNPPLNATGKLDHLALTRRAAEGADGTAQDDAVTTDAPLTDLEHALATDLATILRIRQIGPDDDFFMMGGDSLLTLQYISALGRQGLAATPQDIQQGRTIRGVLARVRPVSADTHDSGATRIGLTPMGRKFFERLPLTDRHHWQQLLVIRFDHMPDLARLNHAMTRVHAHHPLLRAHWDGSQLVVPEAGEVDIHVVDLRRSPWPLNHWRLDRLVSELREEAVLDGDCLSAAMLVRIGRRDVRLFWVLHHLIVDANCWRPLVDDLATTYRNAGARLLGTASAGQLVDSVERHVDEALGELAQRPAWKRMPIPGRPGTSGTGQEGRSRTLRDIYTPEETRRMYAALREDTNLNLLLLSGLSLALRQWARQEDVRFDVISNGRSVDHALDLSRTVGWFATHNPFQVSLPDRLPVHVLDAVASSWHRYQSDSAWFVAACNTAHQRAIEPLASHTDQALLYSFLGDFDSLSLPDGWQIAGSHGRNRGASNPRTHELELEALVANGRLMIRLVHATSRVRRKQAAALLQCFRQALGLLIRHLEKT